MPSTIEQLYQKVFLIRAAEAVIKREYGKNEMATPMHMSQGEEGIVAAVCQALGEHDRVMGTYRSHALYLAQTGDVETFFAEMLGRDTSPQKGKGGSMHLFAPARGLYGTTAIVGSQFSVALGLAMERKSRRLPGIVAVFFGDGAVDEGAFLETLNAACLYEAPLLFVCEDNELAVHTSKALRRGYSDLGALVRGYKCHSHFCHYRDDPNQIYDQAYELRESIVKHGQPGFLHASWYRQLEHVGVNEDFNAGYRVLDETLAKYDPALVLRMGLSPQLAERIEEEIKARVEAALQAARAALPPRQEVAFEEVLGPEPKVERTQGETLSTTYERAILTTLHEEMARDPAIHVFGIGVPDHKHIFGTTIGLQEGFGPDRVFDTPIAEGAMTGMGVGMAMAGLRPVHVHIRADFLTLAMDQLVNMAANIRYLSHGMCQVPLVVRAIVGRGWGQGAQHSKSLWSWFAHVPGLRVVMPATPEDAKGLLTAALAAEDPTIMFEHRWLYWQEGQVPQGRYVAPMTGAKVLRPGRDITLVGISWGVVEAFQAAQILERVGVQAEVVDLRVAAPLDLTVIRESVERTGVGLVVDVDWLSCGLGAEILARFAERGTQAVLGRMGMGQAPCPTARALEHAYYTNAGRVAVEAVTRLRDAGHDVSMPEFSSEECYSHGNRFKGPF